MLDWFLQLRRGSATRLDADGDAEMIILGFVLVAIGTLMVR